MIAASTYLPSASSSTIAASSIHGTGAQNFSSAMRNGCMLVSGIAFGPNFSSRPRASWLVRPFRGLTSAALAAFGDWVRPLRASASLTPSGDGTIFFSTSGRGRDFKLSLRMVLKTGLRMDAVDPEVDLALGREIALAPTRMLV